MRERHKTIEFDAFGQYRVVIVVCQNMQQAIEKQGHEVPEDMVECKAITYHLPDVKESVIFLRAKPSIADIVHECWHVIYRMHDYFHAELEDEVVAYHLDYLCQKTFDFVKRRR